MTEQSGSAQWGSAQWRAQAVAWLDRELAAAGIARVGEVTQPHLRPWATVLTAPTSRGPVWLKAAGPGTAFEVRLYEILRREAPDRVLHPIAVDVERGWIVLPDGGPPVGERPAGPDLVDTLATVLRQYGQLQRELVPAVSELLAAGVTDMRATVMPERFDQALDAVAADVARHGDPVERARFGRLPGFRSTYAGWCRRLAGSPVPASLDHNDLHAWNMLVTGQGAAAQGRFYDWGDSVVAHPFASMLIGLGFLQFHLGAAAGGPELARLRDAYLDAFDDLGPRPELVDTLQLACRVAKVARALTWHRALAELRGDGAGEQARLAGDGAGERARLAGDGAGEQARLAGDGAGEFAGNPLRCLVSLLAESYLGAP